MTNKTHIIHSSFCVTNRPDSKNPTLVCFVKLWVGLCVKYSIIASRSEAAKSISRGLDLARSPEK